MKNKYIYNYSDHLGNTRLSYFHNGSSIEVLEESNYYPFGLKHDGYNALNGNPAYKYKYKYKYKYNGKELQEETGMYDYGARFYMPDIGRWGVIDPMAEKYRRWSPYNYAVNNPIMFIDPDGRDVTFSGAAAISFGSFLIGQAKAYNAANAEKTDDISFFSETGDEDESSQSPKDDITVNSKGVISNILRNGKPNRFFDESGKQMFFNDPKGVNKNFLTRKFNVGEKAYYPVSIDEMFSAFKSVPLSGYIKTSRFSLGSYAAIWKESTMGEADFSAHYLSRVIGEPGEDVNLNDSSYNIRFGNSNMMFSLMDAGNAMWGLWMRSIGVTNLEIKKASNWYEKLYNGAPDTAADQRAIFYFLNILDKNK